MDSPELHDRKERGKEVGHAPPRIATEARAVQMHKTVRCFEMLIRDKNYVEITIGCNVIVREIPTALISDLPPDEQREIRDIVNSILVVQGFDEFGNVELEFGTLESSHTVWICPTSLEVCLP